MELIHQSRVFRVEEAALTRWGEGEPTCRWRTSRTDLQWEGEGIRNLKGRNHVGLSARAAWLCGSTAPMDQALPMEQSCRWLHWLKVSFPSGILARVCPPHALKVAQALGLLLVSGSEVAEYLFLLASCAAGWKRWRRQSLSLWGLPTRLGSVWFCLNGHIFLLGCFSLLFFLFSFYPGIGVMIMVNRRECSILPRGKHSFLAGWGGEYYLGETLVFWIKSRGETTQIKADSCSWISCNCSHRTLFWSGLSTYGCLLPASPPSHTHSSARPLGCASPAEEPGLLDEWISCIILSTYWKTLPD